MLSGLFADPVDEASYRRVIDVFGVNDCVAGGYTAWQACHASRICHSEFYRQITHIVWLLRNNQANHALAQILDSVFCGVEGDNLHLATQARGHNRVTCTLGTEHVNAEDTYQIGISLQLR